ncbi:antithrombin-iii-like protein [Lasius niger]|uniref:Antithrombin-iii-like protein n=1 Tax=Lasius niger TaxID=67767 RepID=A0A0J7K5Y5_LASNI|nr:antithrombin-iii-like protein [Lasius niger]
MFVYEFPYTNEDRSLFMLIPSSMIPGAVVRRFPVVNGIICDLIERLSTEEGICTLRNLLESDTLSEDVSDFTKSPNFDLETYMPMRALLRDLGIEELVKPDAINLDSFFVDDDSVHFGNAVHRTHVKVTEEDTVAGAVNVIYTGQEDYHVLSSDCNKISQNYYFPYVWLIYDKQRRNVLFAGAFNKSRSLNCLPV